MFLIWDDAKYASGFEEIDAQHKELFNRINELLTACTTSEGFSGQVAEEQALNMVDFLGKYVIEHFKCEEECMERHRCPLAAVNKVSHTKFLQDFTEIKEKIEREGLTRGIIVQLEGLLVGWITKHIQRVDAELRKVQPQKQQNSTFPPKAKKRKSFFARLWGYIDRT